MRGAGEVSVPVRLSLRVVEATHVSGIVFISLCFVEFRLSLSLSFVWLVLSS